MEYNCHISFLTQSGFLAFLLFLFFWNWSMIDLQCINFMYTTIQIYKKYIFLFIFSCFIGYYKVIECSSLCCTVGPCHCILFFFFFWLCLWHMEAPGQGLNPCHNSKLSCFIDNTGSLTHCATRESTFLSFV